MRYDGPSDRFLCMNLPISYSPVPVSWHFLIETLSDDRVSAWVAQWPDCRVIADSRDDAIDALNEALEARLQRIEVLAKPERAMESEIVDDFPSWSKDDPGFIELMRGFREERELEPDNPAYTVDW
jgi:hypothetical protein